MSFLKINLQSLSLMLFVIIYVGCRGNRSKLSDEEYNRTRQEMIEVNRIMIKKDQQKILGYIKRQGFNMIESGTGLWYEIINAGNGEMAKEGLHATIKYTISLLDGRECYNSDIDGEKTFLIGQGGVESGLEEGILLLKAGGKAKFIMPPHLAYGLPGDGERISARAIIVYDVELIGLN